MIEVRDDAQGIAELVYSMYSDYDLLKEKSLEYQEYAREHFSVEAVWNNIKEEFS